MLSRQLLFLFIFLLLQVTAAAQQPAFKIIQPQYELEYIPFNNKNDLGLFEDINEDNDGNLWFTGTKGLQMFDGNRITTYTSGEKPFSLLPDSSMGWLYSLQKDKAGNFWIQEGEKRSLYFDTRRRKILLIADEKIDTTNKLYTSAIDSNDVYFTTYHNNINTFSICRKIKNQPLQEIYKTRQNIRVNFYYRFCCNNHWIINKDVIKKLTADGKKETLYHIPGGVSFYYNDDKNNFYLINGRQDAMYKWNAVTDSMEFFSHLPASILAKNINGFYVWGDQICLASNRYCFMLNKKDNSLQDLSPLFFEVIKKETPGGPGVNFMKFFMKSDSSLFLCTQSYIYRLQKKVPAAAIFKETVESNAVQISFRQLTQDDKKNIYASYYTGIAKKSAGSGKFIPLPVQQYMNGDLVSTYSLNYYKGHLYWNNVDIDLSTGRHRYVFGDKFSGHTTQFIEHDTLWLFSWGSNELYCYEPAKNKLTIFPIDRKLTGTGYLFGINSILSDAYGKNLWIATSSNGLALLTKKGALLKQYLSKDLGIEDNNITSLFLQNETVWFGCAEGLGALDTASGKTIIYRNPSIAGNGFLQNRAVFSIEADSIGNFYLGSSKGLLYFNTKEKEFYNLPEGHPLSTIEFNRPSTLKAPGGRYYFGSIDGLFSFLPSQLEFIKVSNKLRPIVLNAVSIFSNAEKKFRYITQNLPAIRQLILQHEDNNIELDFSVPEFYKKVYYSYRIREQGNQWTEYKYDSKVLVYGLPPGRYLLEVKASTALTDENAVYYSLPIIMPQVWYKKWWVVSLFVLSGLLLILLLVTYRYTEKLKRQKDLASLRTKISSDLHDDVGTILSGLAMQSQMLTYSAKEEQKQSLLEISSMSRDAMERMRDTVWAMDSRKDKFENLIDRMRDFAEKNLSMKKMTHEFIISDIDTKKFIDPEKRQAIYLIFKEAITNIIKHSDGKHVVIKFAHEKSRLHLSIQDDGPEKDGCNSDGLGMSNMKMRAEKIGGTLRTRYEDGFVVELSL